MSLNHLHVSSLMRMSRAAKFVAAITLSLCTGMASAEVLRGHATDNMGAAIGGAYVFAYDNQKHPAVFNRRHRISTITNRNGNFVLDLAPGFYDVCVFSAGFTASCQKMIIAAAKRTDYKVKLLVDPLVIRERGDRF